MSSAGGLGRIGFGIQLLQDGHDYPTVRSFSREAERLGYDSIWVNDHLISPLAGRRAPMLEAWTTLCALAAETSRIRLGALVVCNSFRHPSLLAKMAATLDHIAGGRLEFGIGAGWYEGEYKTFGYEFPRVAVRLAQMGEALDICKRMWTLEKPTFTGQYYRIENAVCRPKCVQEPHPPIWIGGEGEKLTLRLVARFADKWNCPSLRPADIARKLAVLEQHCSEVGRDESDIEKTWYGHLVLEDSGNIAEPLQRRAKLFNLPVHEFVNRTISGSPRQCIDQLEELVAARMTYFILSMGSLEDLDTPRLFADKVIAHFR